MGEDPEPYEPGDGCDICWGPGKAFGDYPTPRYVNITYAGMVGDCAEGNQTFVATQSGIFPCLWTFDDGTFFGIWQAGPGNSRVTLGRRDPDDVCVNIAAAICIDHFEQGAIVVDIT